MGSDVVFVAVFILGVLAGSLSTWVIWTRKTSWGAFEVVADAGDLNSGNVNIRFPEEPFTSILGATTLHMRKRFLLVTEIAQDIKRRLNDNRKFMLL